MTVLENLLSGDKKDVAYRLAGLLASFGKVGSIEDISNWLLSDVSDEKLENGYFYSLQANYTPTHIDRLCSGSREEIVEKVLYIIATCISKNDLPCKFCIYDKVVGDGKCSDYNYDCKYGLKNWFLSEVRK